MMTKLMLTGPRRCALVPFMALCLLLVSGGPAARADVLNPDSVFVVPKVSVEAQAADASTAQRQARNLGRRRAMDILLRRLTAESDWIYLPRLAINQPAPASGSHEIGADISLKEPLQLTSAELPALEEGFSVFNEKSSRSSYSAQITYRFKPEAVRNLLKQSNIPFSESQTRKALIIPVLKTDQGAYLWETNNPWARAWLARPLVNELTPMLLPRGDLDDMDSISAQQALGLNQSRLEQMAEKYQVTQVIVAIGRLSMIEDQYRLQVQLKNGYLDRQGRVAFNFNDKDETNLYDDDDGFGERPSIRRVSQSTGSKAGSVLSEGWYRGSKGDFPALAERAVESIVSKYASSWKSQTLIDHAQIRNLRVTAWFSSIDEWAQIRAALEDTPLVHNIKVEALTSDGATIFIEAAGDVGQLVLAMKQRNLILWSDDDVSWNIATPQTANGIIGLARPTNYLPEINQSPEQELMNSTNAPVQRTIGGGFSAPSPRELQMIQPVTPPSPVEDGLGRGTILGPDTTPLDQDNSVQEDPNTDQDSMDDELESGLY